MGSSGQHEVSVWWWWSTHKFTLFALFHLPFLAATFTTATTAAITNNTTVNPASVVFMSQIISPERKVLAVFPVFLFYIFISWMVLIQ